MYRAESASLRGIGHLERGRIAKQIETNLKGDWWNAGARSTMRAGRFRPADGFTLTARARLDAEDAKRIRLALDQPVVELNYTFRAP
jgi:hypothetical protein